MLLPETTYLPTEDGWRLALHYLPGRPPRRRFPILMVHGLGANRLNFDLGETYSLARAATARGFEVYSLDLRGAGLSLGPGGRRPSEFEWGFTEYATIDLPLAVRSVLSIANAKGFHGVGHSMGGLLLYSFGVRRPPELRSIAAVGSPLICELDLAATEQRLLKLAARIAPQSSERRLPFKSFLGLAGRFIAFGSLLADGLLLNGQNCDAEVVSRLAREGVNDIPLQLVLEITQQMMDGHSGKGPYAYEQQLDRIAVPVLALSGSVDRIAPAPSVLAATLRMSGPDVRYRELGQRFGDRADYGHIDLMVGCAAPAEVYPTVLDFLEEYD